MTENIPDPCPCLTCALWTAAKAWFAKEGAPEDAIDEEALLSTIGDMAGEIMANACCEEEGSNRFEILLAAIQERCQEEGHKFEVEKQELPSSSLMN